MVSVYDWGKVADVLRSLPTWRRAVTLLCLVGVLSPAAVGMAADPQQQLERVEEELDDARSELGRVERRKAVELADLERVDARRAELERELAQLNDKLEVAEAELADSSATLERTTQRLVETESKLADTGRELKARKARFAARARATYMYGGQSSWTSVVTGVDSIEAFQRGLKYARSVMRRDQEDVERIAALEQVVQRTSADLADLQQVHAAQRRQDQERRDAAAAIVAEREEVTTAVQAEAEKRRLLVARLESDRRSYVAMVDELETQGSQIEEQLRRIAEEQRRAAEEAARRQAAQEEEARRLAAAERKRAQSSSDESAPAPPTTSTGGFQWPANGSKTSNYGWRTHPIFGTRRFHAGIDIGAGYGAPIVAAAAGAVVSAGWQGGYGNTVVIDHGGGLATLYAHQSSIGVVAGQSVQRGQTIGAVGSTGYSTGPHLHFEVRVNGATRDPMQYF